MQFLTFLTINSQSQKSKTEMCRNLAYFPTNKTKKSCKNNKNILIRTEVNINT